MMTRIGYVNNVFCSLLLVMTEAVIVQITFRLFRCLFITNLLKINFEPKFVHGETSNEVAQVFPRKQ